MKIARERLCVIAGFLYNDIRLAFQQAVYLSERI